MGETTEYTVNVQLRVEVRDGLTTHAELLREISQQVSGIAAHPNPLIAQWWLANPPVVAFEDVADNLRAEAHPSHLWPCGCLKNNAGAHRAGCPDHPEGVRGS